VNAGTVTLEWRLTAISHRMDAEAGRQQPSDEHAYFCLCAVYRGLRPTGHVNRELAEYEKLRTMKDNLRNIYDTSGSILPR
jgi:hypothetical protein